MVTRKSGPAQQPPEPSRTASDMERGIARLERLISELEAFDPKGVSRRFAPEVNALQAKIEGVLDSVFGRGTGPWHRYADAISLDNGSVAYGEEPTEYQIQLFLNNGKKQSLALLRAAVEWLRDELNDAEDRALEQVVPAPKSQASAATPSNKVFVVHGHDDASKQAVARYVEKMGFEAIVLHEQANKGQTIIEKFEEHADVGYAIVLLTPDDTGGPTGGKQQPRARQNVVFELGYFLGKLGRKHVCALNQPGVELPSDISGVVWVELDKGEAWKMTVAREMKAVGYSIDWNKVMG